MKLNAFLRAEGVTLSEFANQVGVNVATIHRAAHGKVMPTRQTLEAIYRVSNGQVTPNDFCDLKTDTE